jgi:hypothetical protein
MSPPDASGPRNDLEQALFGDERLHDEAAAADRPLVVKYGTVKLRVQPDGSGGARPGGDPNTSTTSRATTAPESAAYASAPAPASDHTARAPDRPDGRRGAGALATVAAVAAALLLLAAVAAGLLTFRARPAAGTGRAPAAAGAGAR